MTAWEELDSALADFDLTALPPADRKTVKAISKGLSVLGRILVEHENRIRNRHLDERERALKAELDLI